MEPQFHLRGEIGLDTPTSTSGATRPLLLMNRPIHTVHYTGIFPRQIFFSGGDGIFDTIEQFFDYINQVESIARRAGKPFEYNTFIPVMSDNSSHVCAYADEYVAAHSAGENTISHGTQFATGVDQPLNEGAKLAFRWWNAVLEATGRLANPSEIVPHCDMDGAQTACPGKPILSDMAELRLPYVAPVKPKPTTPVTTKELLMITVFQPDDCAAEFIGMTDQNGNALEVEWIQTASDQRRRDNHLAAGARIDTGGATHGRFTNCNLIGPIPTGDSYQWSERDFHKIRP